ncbi:MAG: hypothetical protein PVJ53_15520 [Desulfobacterales bacterium]|jgi:simple sugar transport system permease protein
MLIFATGNPLRAAIGAFLFGGLTALQFYFQALGLEMVAACIVKMRPYIPTIAVVMGGNPGP